VDCDSEYGCNTRCPIQCGPIVAVAAPPPVQKEAGA